VFNNGMDDSNSSLQPARSGTLKLKSGARRAAQESKPSPAPPAVQNSKLKAGAHWSDEYKERMQADMDALNSR